MSAGQPGGSVFEQAERRLGLAFSHSNGMDGEYHLPEVMGAGVALFDYDNDGDLDVYLVQGGTLAGRRSDERGDRLFRNDLDEKRGLRFTDVSAALPGGGYGMGVATGDYDNDGYTDLYLTRYGADQLLRNAGDGRFVDVTDDAGIDNPYWSVSASFVDLDGDGWLDVFVGNYVDFDIEEPLRCLSPARTRDYCGPQSLPAVADKIYRNRGDGSFADVSDTAGIAGSHGAALGVVAADYNADGHTDLFVANDGAANHLWINSGESFSDEAMLAGVALNSEGGAEASMGIALADYDRDGDDDLFLTHLIRETNTLYAADGKGWFDDRTAVTGLAAPSIPYTGFGTGFVDYDNDGWVDLLVVNGGVTFFETPDRIEESYPLDRPNQLFRNTGNARFTVVNDPAVAVSEVSRGAAFGDLDNDGDTDVVITNNNGPARVLLNKVGSRHAWLGIELVRKGPVHNARVAIDDDGPRSWRRVQSDGSYASASDPRVVFGLGRDADPRSVLVQWPGGELERFADLETRRYHRLEQGRGTP